MKKSKTVSKQYVLYRLSQISSDFESEATWATIAVSQLGHAGKFQLKLSDHDMERIERYFRGRVSALKFAQNLIKEMIANVKEEK